MSHYESNPGLPLAYHDQALRHDAYPNAHQRSAYPAGAGSSYLELGKLGATVGLCGAAAANLHKLRNEQVTGGEAIIDSLRTGAAAGLATAAAGYIANQFRSPTTSLAATLIAGTAFMYLLNSDGPVEAEGDKS